MILSWLIILAQSGEDVFTTLTSDLFLLVLMLMSGWVPLFVLWRYHTAYVAKYEELTRQQIVLMTELRTLIQSLPNKEK